MEDFYGTADQEERLYMNSKLKSSWTVSYIILAGRKFLHRCHIILIMTVV